jgi:hypothetical protein
MYPIVRMDFLVFEGRLIKVLVGKGASGEWEVGKEELGSWELGMGS